MPAPAAGQPSAGGSTETLPLVLQLGRPQDRHLFSLLGRHFWVDVASGAVHELDPLTHEVLAAAVAVADATGAVSVAALVGRLAPRHDPADVRGVLAELAELCRQGLLFTPDTGRPHPANAATPAVRLSHLCLHVVHGCNLRCDYCFAGDGDYGKPETMAAATARAAVAFFAAHAGPYPELGLEFFGGEPLLNLEAIAAAVDAARRLEADLGRRFRFSISTNGTLFSAPVRRFLVEHDFDVVVSLDGRPEVHDARRRLAGDQGSYDRIVAGARALAAAMRGGRLALRGVFTRHNPAFVADALHLADLGFASVSIEPVAGQPDGSALCPATAARAEAAYAELAQALVERLRAGQAAPEFPPLGFSPGQPLAYSRCERGCGAGRSYLAVAPSGAVFPCHRFVHRPEFAIGRVSEGITAPAVQARFAEPHVQGKPACAGCWARYYCGGGCHANAVEAHGTILQPDPLECRLRLKRLEVAFWLQAEQADLAGADAGGAAN